MNLCLLRARNIFGRFNKAPIFNFITKPFSDSTSTPQAENVKPFQFTVDRKKIYNKKTHYRSLEIENKLDPTKTLEDQDERELLDWHKKLVFNKKYLEIHDDWQKNLIRKKEKKAKTKHLLENYVNTLLTLASLR